jgi:flagellar assembly factor FliW
MRIATTRFGEIDIQESELITMKGSILGFGHLKRFALIVHDQNTHPLVAAGAPNDPRP